MTQAHGLDRPPPRGTVRAYTDGSQQEGQDGRQYAGYGVWYDAENSMNECGPIQGPKQTNNRAEMTACIRVLEEVPMTAPLQLCVDSQLVTVRATQWIGQWRRRG